MTHLGGQRHSQYRRRPVFLEPLPTRRLRIVVNFPLEKATRGHPESLPQRHLPPIDVGLLAERVRGGGEGRTQRRAPVRLGADIQLNNSNIFYAQARKDAFISAQQHRQEQQLKHKRRKQQEQQRQRQQPPSQHQEPQTDLMMRSAPKSISMFIKDRKLYAMTSGPILHFDIRATSPQGPPSSPRHSLTDLEEAMDQLVLAPGHAVTARESVQHNHYLSKLQADMFSTDKRLACLYLNMDLPSDYGGLEKRAARHEYPLLETRRAREEALERSKLAHRGSCPTKEEHRHPQPSPSSAPHILSKITLPDASQPVPGQPARYPWRLTEPMEPPPPPHKRRPDLHRAAPSIREARMNPEQRYRSHLRRMARMHFDMAMQHERTVCEPPPPPQTAISMNRNATLETFLERRPSSTTLLPRPASNVSILVENINKGEKEEEEEKNDQDTESIEDARSLLTVPAVLL